MERQTFANVWDALENTPAESASMTMRSDLLIAVCHRVSTWNLAQPEASKRLDVTAPRLNELLRGSINSFSLEELIDLARRAGLVVGLNIAEAA